MNSEGEEPNQDAEVVSVLIVDNKLTSNNCVEHSNGHSSETKTLKENGHDNEIRENNVMEAGSETPYHRKQRKKSHLVIYATTFIMSIGFSIVLTGIWPYLQMLEPSASKELLGWVVAINPLGQMIASPFLGWYGVKRGSNRCSFIITVVMFIGGNILYALLPLFKNSAKYIMLISRFIVGISSANIAVCRSYISSSTKQTERTIALSITAASQSMGFILGPSIQTALAYVHPLSAYNSSHGNLTDVEGNFEMTGNHLSVFNMYSLTGWFTALLGFLNFFLLLPCVYKEFNIATSEELTQPLNDGDKQNKERKPDFFAVFFLLFSYFSILLIYVIVETLIVPMCLDLYAWTSEFTVQVVGLGLTVIGVIAFFVFIAGGRLARRFNDRKVFIICGLIPLALSVMIFFPVSNTYPKIKHCSNNNNSSSSSSTVPTNDDISFANFSSIITRVRRGAVSNAENCDGNELGCPSTQEWCFYTPIIEIPQLIAGACLMTLGYPIGISLAGAILSKMLRAKEQGIWMGILTSVGSFSRFTGPIFVSYLYTAKGPLWTFATLFVLLIVVLIQNIVFYKRTTPLYSMKRSSLSDL